jgi:hypothetical protein
MKGEEQQKIKVTMRETTNSEKLFFMQIMEIVEAVKAKHDGGKRKMTPEQKQQKIREYIASKKDGEIFGKPMFDDTRDAFNGSFVLTWTGAEPSVLYVGPIKGIDDREDKGHKCRYIERELQEWVAKCANK